VAGALAGNIMLMSVPLYSGVAGGYRVLFEWISFLLAIPSVFYCGRSFFKNVQNGIKNRIFPIDGPILFAILVAFFYSGWSVLRSTHDLYFDSLSALIFLLLSSRYFLSRIRQSAGLNPSLIGLFHAPFQGNRGDQMEISPGATLGFDGKILNGTVWIDQSHFTGESNPVRLVAGDPLFAGCRVVDVDPGVFALVEKVGSETRLQKFLSNLSDARNQRTLLEQAFERWAKFLLMVVLTVAFIATGWFFVSGMGMTGMSRVLALLIVTCPCALAFATPLVYSLAARGLLDRGLLLKNPDSLDRALGIKNIYFDKTGTLTFGSLKFDPRVLKKLSEEELKAFGSIAMKTQHPVSRALYREICEFDREFAPIEVEFFKETPGLGVEGSLQGVRYGIRKSPDAERFGVQFYRVIQGRDLDILTLNFEDELRPDTKEVIQSLQDSGFGVELLSGDHELNAKKVLQGVPISIRADLKPEDKARYAESGMMVGDGVNDALALKAAQIGFSVQGGMEAAIDSSDVYSLRSGVSGVLDFLQMAKVVRKVLVLNFSISTFYNVLGGSLALMGHMSPLLAAVLMPLSATTVFLNSSSLIKRAFKRPRKSGGNEC
jgi:Cu2+-exporting ATPase/Cu+-exporting ATPase